MTDFSKQLSAYVDDELATADRRAVEERLKANASDLAAFDDMVAVNAMIGQQFDSMLHEPVPLALARTVKSLPVPGPRRRALGRLTAASVALFMAGGIAGFVIKDRLLSPARVLASGWLQDVAEHQAVYAKQKRHLVEVGAAEADHIETWLGATVDTAFSIPDLAAYELTFQGGRLLVSNGQPMAQLMYTRPDGAVVALCMQKAPDATAGASVFKRQTIGDFDMVSWTNNGARYVVVAPLQQPDLDAIAKLAAAVI